MKTLSRAIFPKECVAYPNTAGLFLAEPRLGYTKFIFDEGFIHLVRYALSTDCITEFSEAQLEFFNDWVGYQLTVMNDAVSYPTDSPVVAFDAELIKIAECIPDPGEIVCGNSVLHTYNSCTVI